ncbi:MAG: fibrobacter succinogenes major paralogous domain-containing protein [Prevotellaceae bacterium]|jgi:uncharacterized protein (TIGR02145 family)|nr:fibrobacter succinogenes major paralogous domain-containing protein [Prevotellaceae bacterium]
MKISTYVQERFGKQPAAAVLFSLLGLWGTGCNSACAQEAPPHAATARTWEIAGRNYTQTWSDHIDMPACDKTAFDPGTEKRPKADCRHSPGDHFLYTWRYVAGHASELCPSPWRVPAKSDFIRLDKALGGSGVNLQYSEELAGMYLAFWGGAYSGSRDTAEYNDGGREACYWSAGHRGRRGHCLCFSSTGLVTPRERRPLHDGLLLRCILKSAR